MSVYISSNANRFYCSTENIYGQVSAIAQANRIPAVKLTAKQQLEITNRKDKTGSRTFAGLPPGGRRKTTFDLTTYLTTWDVTSAPPSYGPLFQATLGSTPALFAGGTAAAGSTSTTLHFTAPHGLTSGQAVTYLGELRFVAAVVDSMSVLVSAPFSSTPVAGTTIGPTVTYFPATSLPSVSIFDYWSPSTAVHRILCGAGVDKVTVKVNGDFHQFQFSGMAQDLADSTSFSSGVGQLTAFPVEPALGAFDYSIVPGNLGQVWLGSSPSQFFTLTDAQLVIGNNLDVRAQEFGSSLPLALAPGTRNVAIQFELYQRDDAATQALYQAAKQQSPISAMIQLGQQPNQLFGVYLQSVLPEVPEYNDSSARLQWSFASSRAQGTVDNEVIIAFG
jgi:hypothetical protein